MDKNEYFINLKNKALNKLNSAMNENKVDKRIKKIINLINSNEYFYTSSSCAGRIVIIELPELGDKIKAKFLGKWHRKIEYSELTKSIKLSGNGMLWILAQSPILHVITKSNLSADKLIKIAIASGFKNSGFKSYSDNIVIEICSTERLDSPIGRNGILYCTEEHLKLIVDISNDIIERSRKKLSIFEKNLKQNL
jgi:tRNA wybutosine-synthesizing protein 3